MLPLRTEREASCLKGPHTRPTAPTVAWCAGSDRWLVALNVGRHLDGGGVREGSALLGRRRPDSHSSCLPIDFPRGRRDIWKVTSGGRSRWQSGSGAAGRVSCLRAAAKASGSLGGSVPGSSPPHPQEPPPSAGRPLSELCRVPSAARAWNSLFLSLGRSLVH